MNINCKPTYIPGDLVYNHKGEVIRITSSYLKGTRLFYYKTDEIGGSIGCILEEALKPIPLTPEILEKNGWDKDNSKFYEYDDDPEYENRYFNWTYDLTLDLDDCSVYKGTSGILYGLLSEVIYVHQLQHLLFGLGLNHEMKVC